MFEGKPPRAADELPLEEPRAGASRRPRRGGARGARLSAARAVRESLEGGPAGSEASFHARSARCIAAHHNGKHGVNPEDSAYGKGPDGIADQAVHGAATGVARN